MCEAKEDLNRKEATMKKKLQSKYAPKKGVDRAKSWIYAVINPLIDALKVDKAFLKEKNWTWRYETKRIEFILPLEQYVDSAYHPIFEDFLEANSQMERKRKKREDLRAALSENCRIAFDFLIDLQAFQDKVQSSLSAYLSEEPTREHPRGAVPEGDFHKLIAQYVLSQIQELPDHYTTSRFWSRFRNEFLQFRTGEVFERLDASGKELEREDDRLLTALKNLRSSLVEEYDIPAAPISYMATGQEKQDQ